ncbi:hypothetical protein GJ496_007146 [Pomphorhynchus laevis]|nr:hypothetical protein GJ496_007146 [Pomphorhynchus laevis]
MPREFERLKLIDSLRYTSMSSFQKKDSPVNEIIIPLSSADKGSKTVVMDKTEDKNFKEMANTVLNTIKNHVQDEKLAKSLVVYIPILDHMDLLPKCAKLRRLTAKHVSIDELKLYELHHNRRAFQDKISKSEASTNNTVTNLSSRQLTPIQSFHAHLNSTSDFLNKLKTYIEDNSVMAQMDVESLYTSIRHDMGISAVVAKMKDVDWDSKKISFISDAMKIVELVKSDQLRKMREQHLIGKLCSDIPPSVNTCQHEYRWNNL